MIDIWTEDHSNTETPEDPSWRSTGLSSDHKSGSLLWAVFWGFSCPPDAQITKDELLEGLWLQRRQRARVLPQLAKPGMRDG